MYVEPASELIVEAECDILVVGGGAAGHSAAIAAARAGAKNIILLERYGYMGGDVTGGYVIMVPNLSWYDKSFVRGLQEEWFTVCQKFPEQYVVRLWIVLVQRMRHFWAHGARITTV